MDSVQYYEPTWVNMRVHHLSTVRNTKTCLAQKSRLYIKFSRQLQIFFFRHRLHWRKWIRPDVNIISSGICYGYMSKLKMPGFSITKTQIMLFDHATRGMHQQHWKFLLTVKGLCYSSSEFQENSVSKSIKDISNKHYQTIMRVKEGFQFRYFCRPNQFLWELSLVF